MMMSETLFQSPFTLFEQKVATPFEMMSKSPFMPKLATFLQGFPPLFTSFPKSPKAFLL